MPAYVRFTASLFSQNAFGGNRVILSVTYVGIAAIIECDKYTYTRIGGDFVICVIHLSDSPDPL